MAEYPVWFFDGDLCPHDMIEAEHCDQCCVDIGDAERSMRFDKPDDDEPQTLTEEWALDESRGWGSS